jgi:hypothetical protein
VLPLERALLSNFSCNALILLLLRSPVLLQSWLSAMEHVHRCVAQRLLACAECSGS